ncbi:MAG: hypothetical protein ACRD5H_10520, partial [Nitrososphaerales archaeon]
PSSPQVAASGSNVYVVWQDDDEILLASSSDNGATFSPTPINISNSSGVSFSPQVAASGSNVYVVWQDDDEILLASSSDNGATFSTTDNLSANDGLPSSPQVAASGSNVYVVWQDDDEILLASSSDNGATFSTTPINISNSSGVSFSQTIQVSGDGNAHVVWVEVNADETSSEIYLSTITDNESSVGCPIDLSSNSGFSFSPRMSLAGGDNRLHIVWEDSAPGVFEVQMQHNIDPLEPVAVINPISSTSLKVDDPLEISGTVANAADGDKIEVDWGDGTSDEVSIEGCSWGPVTHAYGPSAISSSPNQLVANLLSSDDTLKVSSIHKEITVQQKPFAGLTLDPVAHVVLDTAVTVTGRLVDSETLEPIADSNITFNGTGAVGLAAATTDGTGDFIATGAAIGTPGNGLTVQAHFGGNAEYAAVDSDVRTFDTIDPTAIPYLVPDGSSSIDLSEFNATIDLKGVVQDGTLYASECNSTDPRFLPLDACLRLSPAFQMTEQTSANVTMSFVDLEIPDGYSGNDLSIFRITTSPDGLKVVSDITASKSNETITGTTT